MEFSTFFFFMTGSLRRCGAIVIKQFHPRKEQFGSENVRTECGTDLNTSPDSSYFFVISEMVEQTFLSTVSQSLKGGSLLLQHIKGI